MIIDARAVEPGAQICSDICIVGSGVAGLALANEFRNSNTTVTIVESGSEEPNAKMQSLNAGNSVIGIPYYDLDKARARAFGGTSHLWHVKLGGARLGVRLLAMDEIDFERRDWVPNSGWPFPKSALDAYYRKAHRFCGIGPYAYTAADWADLLPNGDAPLLGPESHVETKIFQFAEKEFLYRDQRPGIELSSNISVYLNATIVQAMPNPSGSAIEYLDASAPEGRKLRFRAKRYVLAMGGLETPRLMLVSDQVHPRGIGNDHDLVGRYFMEHPHLWSGYVIPHDPAWMDRIALYKVHLAGQTAIMGKLSLTAEIQRREQLLNFATSLHPRFQRLNSEGVAALQDVVRELSRLRFGGEAFRNSLLAVKHWRSTGYHFLSHLRSKIDTRYRHHVAVPNVLVCNVMAEQVPNRESRVTLMREEDFLGIRRIGLDWRLTSQDIESIRKSFHLVGRDLKNNGFGELVMELTDDSIPPTIHGGWHHMGTTRMHADPRKGVVDANCRVHNVANLFIAGASVFPTVGCANPVLTTVALSLRLADHLKNSPAA